MNNKPRIVMVGTSLELQGGVASVIGVYRDVGFFERWDVTYIPTNCTGGALRKTAFSLLATSRFLGLLLRGAGKVVHVHTSSYFSFWRKSLFIAPGFLFRRSVVVSLHGGGFREFYTDSCGPIGRWWIRMVIGKASRFIVLTEGWRQWVLSIVPNANVYTIPNACSDSAWSGAAKSHDCTGMYILFMGRLEKDKGFCDLLLAISRIRNSIPGVRLVCGGTGNKNEVESWIESAGIGDLVELRGWISGAAKHQCFEHAALLALPSYIENLPMVIIEAMAAGVPVVASAVGGIPDVIEDGKDGLLVQPGNVDGLADAIARLLHDPAMRERIARNARQTYENHYSPQCVIPQLELIYEQLGMTPQCAIVEGSRA